MSDTDDQITPKDDFSQSIDDISEQGSSGLDTAAQSPDMNEENVAADLAGGASADILKANPTVIAGESGRSRVKNGGNKYDLNTLSGRLEKKIAEIKSILWEKEAMQLQFVFQGQPIREEYYKRWKGESNIFLMMASRLQRRLDKERLRMDKV